MSQTEEDLLRYLREIVQKTNDQKMPWQKANPTTYVATMNDVGARMSLQKISTNSRGAPTLKTIVTTSGLQRVPTPGVAVTTISYFLQVSEMPNGTIALAINEQEATPLGGVLKDLFLSIENIAIRRGIDVLKKIAAG